MLLIAILCIHMVIFAFISYQELLFLDHQKKQKAAILSENEYQKAADIAIENVKFRIFSSFYATMLNIIWLGFGFTLLKTLLIQENSLVENTLFLLTFLVLMMLLNLPLSLYESLVKDKAQGFSNMTLGLFLKDFLKSLALLVIFGFLIIYALLFCYEFLGKFWWIAAFVLSFCIILIIDLIYPTLIAPLFNKMQRLDDENLLEKIQILIKKCGFSANGVFIMDASKRDKRLNAYFGGLFKSKRVVLFDTLLKALSERELLAVLGHELGHFVHKDILKALFSGALMLFALFFIFAHLPEFFYHESGLSGVNAGVFALLFIFGNVFLGFFSPFLNFFSRKNEFAADAYGAALTSKDDMKNALIALARENKAFIRSSKIYTLFHLSHPSIDDRIRVLA